MVQCADHKYSNNSERSKGSVSFSTNEPSLSILSSSCDCFSSPAEVRNTLMIRLSFFCFFLTTQPFFSNPIISLVTVLRSNPRRLDREDISIPSSGTTARASICGKDAPSILIFLRTRYGYLISNEYVVNIHDT